MGNFPDTIEISFADALASFDAISGVVYKNTEWESGKEEPEAYMACMTMAKCWMVDAIPMNKDYENDCWVRLEGIEVGIPVNTECFGEPLDFLE